MTVCVNPVNPCEPLEPKGSHSKTTGRHGERHYRVNLVNLIQSWEGEIYARSHIVQEKVATDGGRHASGYRVHKVHTLDLSRRRPRVFKREPLPPKVHTRFTGSRATPQLGECLSGR